MARPAGSRNLTARSMFQERLGGNQQSVQEIRGVGVGFGGKRIGHQAGDQAAVAMARMRPAGRSAPPSGGLGLGDQAQGGKVACRQGQDHQATRQRGQFMGQRADQHCRRSGRDVDPPERPRAEAKRNLRHTQ